MLERPRYSLSAYGVAIAATVVTLLIRLMLKPALGNAMTFFPAVMIAAYLGGFWPGMLETVLGALAGNYFTAEQTPAFHISNTKDVASLILFALWG